MNADKLVQGALDRLTGKKPLEIRPRPKTSADWLAAWRELAKVTYGITADDRRFEPVMRWLDVADTAFALDSWPAFCEAAEEIRRIAKEKP